MRDDFLWGAALSAHPAEGGNFANDWWRWEQRPGRIVEGAISKSAAGHFDRFEGDFDLARKLGHRAHLVTMEWSRVQPAPDTFDDAAIGHYSDVLDALRSRGIEPIGALHHVTNPQWFAERGGWGHPAAPRLFERYVERVAPHWAPKCRWWIPIREPIHTLDMGYIERLWPPGSANLYRGVRALKNLARAHARAYRIIHGHRADAMVGAAIRGRVLTPSDENRSWDLRAARWEQYRRNHVLIEALQHGRWPMFAHTDADVARTLDFIGVSYFGSETVRFNPMKPLRLCSEPTGRSGKPARHAQPTPDPDGFYALLHDMTRHQIPLLITGNGIATDNDGDRCRCLLEHVSVVLRGLHEGMDIRGYLYYSLLDGFEWEHGYAARYGLIHTDRETLARTPNASAYLYKDICENGAVRPGAVAQFCPGWTPKEERAQ